MAFRRTIHALLLLALAGALSSCILPHNRHIVRQGAGLTPKLLVADQKTLLAEINREYDAVNDFNATVDMVPALGSAENNRITEYKDIRAYIIFRKPDSIRIIGLLPVVRSKAFDMVSTGERFGLYIPAKNLFIEGANDIVEPSKNKLENLRPQHFVDALLVKPVDAVKQRVLIENLTDEQQAVYILHVIDDTDGQLRLARTIWFNRVNLQIIRQIILDPQGNILTDAHYSDWHVYDNVAFPKHIAIDRPKDEYAVVIDIVKMDINKGVPDDKFVLEQPEGSTLRILGQTPAAPASPAPPAPAKGKKAKQ
jgi:outer membrane lipoprotein-sorting protein